jgi:hypothetical protein
MKIYDIESKCGLHNKILAQSKIVLSSNKIGNTPEDLSISRELYDKYTQDHMKDMAPSGVALVHSILVTTNWNKNDDIFSPIEVWNARYTPMYKPTNIDHQGRESTENKIIGVIVNSTPVDDEYKSLYGYSTDNSLPDKYHLLVTSYLWEVNFPEAISNIKEGIKKQKMFVSMECVFNDFGYAIKRENDNEASLISRTEDTAWLTQYLRSYGGKGSVKINDKEYKIGRWLRNFYFSGIGFVKNPANPESIVFEDYISQASLKFKDVDSDAETYKSKNFEDFDSNGVLTNTLRKIALWPM